MTKHPVALFTWGYWGWGTTTDRLVEAAGVVERARGFKPPLFVDIRIQRSVRAAGFKGGAFERTVGRERYVWMPSLGNRAVLERVPGIRINDPAAADTLLDLAIDRDREHQRMLFFCSCKLPGREDNDGCHRTAVARLVLEAAERRNVAVEIVEWPGGEPTPDQDPRIVVSANEMKRLQGGSKSIRLGEPASLADVARIPWYSPATVSIDGREAATRRVLTGPVKYVKKTGWLLPRLAQLAPDAQRREVMDRVHQLRLTGGFEMRSTRPRTSH